MTESQRPERGQQDDPADEVGQSGSSEERALEATPNRKPWPKLDPSALQTKKFMTARGIKRGEVAVTASDGEIQKDGAPARLFSRLAERVGDAIKTVGNMPRQPLVIAARAGASMTIVFGDEQVDAPQTSIPYYATWEAAQRIAELMTLDDDELASAAAPLGLGASGYIALSELVQSEGIQLKWEPRGFAPEVLDVERAMRHYERLTQPPQMHKRDLVIEGFLYRVIWDGPTQGRAGIRLSKSSAVPMRRRGRLVIVRYDTSAVEDLIIHGLIGRPVIAEVTAEEPRSGLPLPLKLLPHPVVRTIREGQFYEPMELTEFETVGDDDDDVPF